MELAGTPGKYLIEEVRTRFPDLFSVAGGAIQSFTITMVLAVDLS